MTAKILVVEDEAVIAADIRASLTDLGYSVVGTAASGPAAIAAVHEHAPDLVLMDVRLQGDMDGVETATRIREAYVTPIIFLTSFSDDPTLARAKQAGAYGYLLKPFSPRDLKVAIDVALSKRDIEGQLAERERWFSTTLRSIGDAVIATDADERITFMNSVAENITGWTQGDALGRSLHDVFRLIEEDSGRPSRAPIADALSGGFTVELPDHTSLERKDGKKKSIADSIAPIVTDAGRIVGGVVVFRDITEKKRIEERLAQSERLAAIGTLSAGMAHEINNPLAYILTNVEFALDTLPRLRKKLETIAAPGLREISQELSELIEALGEAKQGSQRVHRIVHDLKRFGRAEASDRAAVDLTTAIDTAERMTENLTRHHARLRREHRAMPIVKGNAGQLGQVFINLFVNAAQSFPDTSSQGNEIVVSTSTDDDGWAVAEVRDNGPGIPKELLGRIFEPFFTTKAVGEGTGLGLSICHSLIQAHGGKLTVESELGMGTTFRISLPPAPAAGEERTEDPKPSEGPIESPRRARVLIVDDEVAIGRAISRILQREHEVFVVASAEEILPRIRAGETFDIVFCDLMMPGMTGIDFYDEVRIINPELARRMVFMTGGAFTQRATEFLDTTENDTLTKPADPRTLKKLIAEYVGLET